MIPQTPWFERKFDFSFPEGLFPVILERLRGTTGRIEYMCAGLKEEILSKKINTAWSIKEQLGHLYDLEDLWYGRIEDFLSGTPVLKAADMTNAKTHNANHNAKQFGELLQEFSHARDRLIKKVEDLDETNITAVAVHPRLGKPMRLADSLFFVAEHDDHHLAKMRSIIRELT